MWRTLMNLWLFTAFWKPPSCVQRVSGGAWALSLVSYFSEVCRIYTGWRFAPVLFCKTIVQLTSLCKMKRKQQFEIHRKGGQFQLSSQIVTLNFSLHSSDFNLVACLHLAKIKSATTEPLSYLNSSFCWERHICGRVTSGREHWWDYLQHDRGGWCAWSGMWQSKKKYISKK